MKFNLAIFVVLFVGAVVLAMLVVAALFFSALFIPISTPTSVTQSAITETTVRIHMYVQKHRGYPKDLCVIPKRVGYLNRIIDGWGRPLIYSVNKKGVITLMSLGRDGTIGGFGVDADIIQQFETRNEDGSLNTNYEYWLLTTKETGP